MLKNFIYYLFAPTGRFDACGMFTLPHIISVAVCISLIIFCVIFYINTKRNHNINNLLRLAAVVLSILELIKISHSFIYKELHLDAWFPLSYCGLFIFATWMSGFGNDKIKRIGEVYIAYGCPIAGIAFLVFPTTSLMSFPIWHYFSLYSLFFHSAMIFFGIILLHNEKRLSKQTYAHYLYFVISFAVLSIIINFIFKSNLMNLRVPYNIPINFLHRLYDFMPAAYTVLTLISYSIIPFVVGVICGKIKR